MKPITVHPLSALVGIALASLVLLAMSAQTVAPRDRIVGYVPAEQWTYVALSSIGPLPRSFTVPAGRRLVLTRIDGSYSNVAVNGVNSAARLAAVPYFNQSFTDSSSTRVVLQPGDVLGGVTGFNYDFQTWGYLEPL